MTTHMLCACPRCGCSLNDITPTPVELTSLIENLTAINRPPNDAEIELLRAAVPRLTDEIEQLSTRIHAAEESLLQLSRLHNQRVEISSQCRTFLSSMRRLPPELWAQIFGFCRDSYGPLPFSSPDTTLINGHIVANDERRSSILVHPMPWIISHVSRSWRAFALGFPELWTNMRIILTDPAKECQGYLSLASLQLQRSYPAKLHVKIALHGSVNMAKLNDEWATTIMPHISRCYQMQVDVTGITGSRNGLDILFDDSLSFPALRRVKLRGDALGSILCNALSTAPMLGHVESEWSPLADVGFPSSSSISTLKILRHPSEYDANDPPMLLDLFQTISRSLTNLTLSYSFFNPLPESLTGSITVTIPHLTSLCIEEHPYRGTSALRFITAPQLRTLRIAGILPHLEMIPFIIRSNCPLHELEALCTASEDALDIMEVTVLLFAKMIESGCLAGLRSIFIGQGSRSLLHSTCVAVLRSRYPLRSRHEVDMLFIAPIIHSRAGRKRMLHWNESLGFVTVSENSEGMMDTLDRIWKDYGRTILE